MFIRHKANFAEVSHPRKRSTEQMMLDPDSGCPQDLTALQTEVQTGLARSHTPPFPSPTLVQPWQKELWSSSKMVKPSGPHLCPANSMEISAPKWKSVAGQWE